MVVKKRTRRGGEKSKVCVFFTWLIGECGDNLNRRGGSARTGCALLSPRDFEGGRCAPSRTGSRLRPDQESGLQTFAQNHFFFVSHSGEVLNFPPHSGQVKKTKKKKKQKKQKNTVSCSLRTAVALSRETVLLVTCAERRCPGSPALW